jgi:hypothetical protein
METQPGPSSQANNRLGVLETMQVRNRDMGHVLRHAYLHARTQCILIGAVDSPNDMLAPYGNVPMDRA